MRTALSSPHVFTYGILALYASAAVRYAFAADWARTVYWCAAGTLTVTVTWFLK